MEPHWSLRELHRTWETGCWCHYTEAVGRLEALSVLRFRSVTVTVR